MSVTEQNKDTLPPPRPLEMDSVVQSTAEVRVPHMPEIQQRPQIPLPQQAMEVSLNHKPTTKPKAPATRADWVNALWADISGQLRRFSVISSELFDGLLLKRHTFTGSLILSELVSLSCFASSLVNSTRDANTVSTAQEIRSTWQ